MSFLLTAPERLLLISQNSAQILGSLSQTRDSGPLAPPLSGPGDWPPSWPPSSCPSNRAGEAVTSQDETGCADSVHLFGLRGQSHDPGPNALGLGILCLLIAEPKGGRHRKSQRHGRGEEAKWLKLGPKKKKLKKKLGPKRQRFSSPPLPSSHSPC